MTERCQDAVALLGPALDGELPTEDSAWIDEHLAGCGSCRERQTLLAAQAAALRERLSARVDLVDFSAFTARVMARVSAAEERPAPLAERLSLWLRETFSANRFALGAGAGLTAAAALALVVVLQPAIRTGNSAGERRLALAAADLVGQAEVEELDVYGQEGTVLQLPGQTLIWVDDQGPARPRSAQ